MKLNGKNSYEEIESGLLRMMYQSIVVRLPAFINKDRAYTRSTQAGVMDSFIIKEAKESKKLTIKISFANHDNTEPFTLNNFEIELLPTSDTQTF